MPSLRTINYYKTIGEGWYQKHEHAVDKAINEGRRAAF